MVWHCDFTDGNSIAACTAGVAYTPSSANAVKIKLSGTSYKVWIDGTLKLDRTTGKTAGGVAFGGDSPTFDNLKIGYDVNTDDDIDDGGDDLVVNEDFSGTSKAFAYDYAGNLVDDGTYFYRYDPWNRLVKVRAKQDDVTIQTASYDGTGRRLKKVVTNAGEHNGTEVYYYQTGWRIAQIDNGSGDMTHQMIHGTQYIDELVMIRQTGRGDLYIHPDANWNVIAATDMGGNVVEKYTYAPYGELSVDQLTSFGDRDGDNDVDATDKGTVGTTCTGTVSGACRILDLDFDGDYDSTDATAFDALTQGLARHPGRGGSGVGQGLGHQGLNFDSEIRAYQNRARQYNSTAHRFSQRDPFAFSFSRFHPQKHYLDSLCAYAYLSASPLGRKDPWGLTPFCDMPCISEEIIEAEACRRDPNAGVPGRPPSGGGVVCLCGRKIPCTFQPAWNDPGSTAIIRRCSVEHERSHLEEVNCSNCPDPNTPCRPPREPGFDPIAEECIADVLEIQCYAMLLDSPDCNAQCRADVENMIAIVLHRLRFNRCHTPI